MLRHRSLKLTPSPLLSGYCPNCVVEQEGFGRIAYYAEAPIASGQAKSREVNLGIVCEAVALVIVNRNWGRKPVR